MHLITPREDEVVDQMKCSKKMWKYICTSCRQCVLYRYRTHCYHISVICV